MATKKTIARTKRATKRTQAEAPGVDVLRKERARELAEGLIADCRARGIKDDGIAFLLTMEAERIMKAATALVPPPAEAPEAAPLSPKKSELAREIVKLVAQSFETGEEGREDTTSILREALRAAKDDLTLFAAAQRQLENFDAATYAFLRAERRIDLALALHEFLTAEDEAPSTTVSRAAELVGHESARILNTASVVRRRAVEADRGAS